MRKRIAIMTALVILLFSLLSVTAYAADISMSVYVDGEQAIDNGLAFFIDEEAYVPVRELSIAMGATTISLDEEQTTAYVVADGLEFTVSEDALYMVANGRYLYMENGCKFQNDRLMVPVSVLCKAFGAEYSWDGTTRIMDITLTNEPVTPGSEFYNSDDLYWLSRIIYAESGNQPLDGKIAVGNVILNRVASSRFPNSIYGVIFDGIQFSPTLNGSIYNSPSEQAVVAAKLVLDGAVVLDNALFFTASYCAASSWAGQNRPFVTQIGDHCFYS